MCFAWRWKEAMTLSLPKMVMFEFLEVKRACPLSTVRQIIGIGSRAFGKSEGGYYTIEFGENAFFNLEQLRLNEKALENSHHLLDKLYRR